MHQTDIRAIQATLDDVRAMVDPSAVGAISAGALQPSLFGLTAVADQLLQHVVDLDRRLEELEK